MSGIVFWLCVLAVFYVYAGYPAFVYLLARVFRRTTTCAPIRPDVTVLFAALNEEKVISKKLENSLALDYPREHLQILVVNDGSVDRTAEIVGQYRDQGVELVNNPQRRGKLPAIKDAIKHVRGEIILFSDADNYYPRDALVETVKYFADPTVGAVSGGRNVLGESVLGNAEGLYWKYEEFIKRQESRLGSCVGVAGDLLAIRRDLYVPPPSNVINDDFYAALSILKQGYRVIYAPEARSSHPVAGSEREEMERRARMVAGRYQVIFMFWKALPWKSPLVLWQVVSHKYLRPLVPLFMILALMANIFSLFGIQNASPGWLFLSFPYNWVFLGLQTVFYLLAWLGGKRKLPGMIGKLGYVPSFLVNSNVAALQGLYRFLTSNQTVMWKKVER
jgi:cellulose synthase/poly-beta-1,6-N-acetylglucosamine synthase-like glycosyltransferase